MRVRVWSYYSGGSGSREPNTLMLLSRGRKNFSRSSPSATCSSASAVDKFSFFAGYKTRELNTLAYSFMRSEMSHRKFGIQAIRRQYRGAADVEMGREGVFPI